MTELLDHQLLLRATSSNAATHLRDLSAKHGERVVTSALINAVKEEMIPATVLPIWLSIVKQSESIKLVLLQDTSRFGRAQAILYIGKWLRTLGRWKEMWAELGGIPGLVQWLKSAPLREVQLFLRAIGKSYHLRLPEREQAVTDLFRVLCSNTPLNGLFGSAPGLNTEERALLPSYFELLPACTAACVETVLSERTSLVAQYSNAKTLLNSHTDLMQSLYRQGYAKQLPFLRRLLTDSPSCKGSEPGFSAPMSFRWSLLQEALDGMTEDQHIANPECDLVKGMFDTALRKNVGQEWLDEITQKSLEFYEKFPRYRQNLGPTHTSLFDKTLKLWDQAQSQPTKSSRDTVIEARLVRLLKLTAPVRPPNVISEVDLLKKVGQSSRYELLRLVATHYYGSDLEAEECLLRHNFDRQLFHSVDVRHAIELLERLIKARPNCDFLPVTPLVNQISHLDPSAIRIQPLVLLEELKENVEGAKMIIAERIEAQTAAAKTTRDQGTRARVASSVIWYVTSSGMLELFSHVSQLLKRFARDPLTFNDLVSQRVITSPANDVIMTGLVKYQDSRLLKPTVENVRDDVLLANNTFRALFEIVLSTRREPTFNAYHWKLVAQLLTRTIQQRLFLAAKLLPRWPGSEEEFGEILWKDTFKLYIWTIQTSFDLEQEETEQNLFPSSMIKPQSLSKLPKSAQTFLDNVARMRDSLWKAHRTMKDSKTVILPRIFPQGLPLHFLLSGGGYDAGWNIDQTPFIISRASSIALMDSDVAIDPVPSEEWLNTIMNLRDDLGCAITVYVLQPGTAEMQTDRLRQIWSHWMSILSDRASMTVKDASLWFRSELRRAPLNTQLKQALISFTPIEPVCDFYPRLPEAFDVKEIFEWNPAEDEPQKDKDKYVASALDCVARSGEAQGLKYHPLHITKERPIEWQPSLFWSTNRFDYNFVSLPPNVIAGVQFTDHLASVPGDIIEGLIATSLLRLDAEVSSVSRLLDSPFPNDDIVRYPRMYLDSDFMDDQGRSNYAQFLLQHLSNRVPPSLLVKLALKHFETLQTLPKDSKEFAPIEKDAFKLLKMIARGDQPQLARDLIFQTIFERRVSTSWNRQLLSAKFLNYLPANSVRMLILEFASRVMGKDKPAKPATPEAKADGVKKQPTINITTLKQLAELLRQAAFIPASLSVDILASVFHELPHLDARVAVLDSMIELFRKAQDRDEKLANQIMDFFQTTVPVIAAINEYQPLSEEDWVQARKLLKVDLHHSEQSQDHSPMCTKMTMNVPLSDTVKKRYVNTVVLPAMRASREIKRRWMEIVLLQHGGDVTLSELAVPFYLDLITRVLSGYMEYISIDDARNWHNLLMANLKPHASLVKFKEYFQSTPELMNCREGRYWQREVFPEQSIRTKGFSTFSYGRILAGEWRPTKRTDGQELTVGTIQRYWLEEAAVLLDICTDPSMATFETFLNDITPTAAMHDLRSAMAYNVNRAKSWLSNARPALQQLHSYVQQKRTAEWQRDQHRHPKYLPSMLRLKLCLLPFPYLTATGTEEERCAQYAKALYSAIAETEPGMMLSSFLPMTAIVKDIRACGTEASNMIVCCLGDPDLLSNGSLNPAVLFCLSLSDDMMNSWAGIQQGPIWERAEQVVRKWCLSENEPVRVLGDRRLQQFARKW